MRTPAPFATRARNVTLLAAVIAGAGATTGSTGCAAPLSAGPARADTLVLPSPPPNEPAADTTPPRVDEAPADPLSWLDPATLPSLEEARTDMAALLAGTKVRHPYDWTAERAAVAQKLGYDEMRAVRLLATFVERGDKRGEILVFEGSDPKTPVVVVDLLFAYLGQVGTARAVAPVFALANRSGSWRSSEAVDTLLEKAALEKLDAKCAPPSPADVAQQRENHAGFAIVERVGGVLVARAPTVAELDDWAYFQAAMARDGGPLGHGETARGASPFAAPPSNQPLDAGREAFELASKNGGPKLVQSAARSYLGLLGYPGPLRVEEESRMTWGGPGYANVMRELARVDEVLGDTAEAAALYRRAPAGGGACGTSVPYRLEVQRKGVIRSAERAGLCHSVVRERLYATHDTGFDYGPGRLAAAGWDVAKLYRASLLTVERAAPVDEIARALDGLPAPQREEARARLARLGAEPWARDVRAIAGLADVEGERATAPLLAIAASGSEAVRSEALTVLAQLADRPPSDPCVPDDGGFMGLRSIGGERPRVVKQRNHVCETKLSASAQAAIVAAFVAAANDPSDRVREAAAEGIARVAEPARAEPILRALAKDPYARPGWSHVGKNNVHTPVLPVAEAAQAALERVREAKKRAQRHRRPTSVATGRTSAR